VFAFGYLVEEGVVYPYEMIGAYIFKLRRNVRLN
jgi:hypothetical protein